MINVSLVGNPNTGKTTLFNSMTYSNEHVGNWHGVTVEEKAKAYKYKGQEFKLVDLPGIYSLSPLSFEEEVSCRYLNANRNDVVINICDASNLKRNLYLTICLLEFGAKVVLVVNQIDKKPIYKVDYSKLSKLLGTQIVYVNAADKRSVDKVKDAVMKCASTSVKYSLPYLEKIDLSSTIGFTNGDRYFALKLLEDDPLVTEKFGVRQNFNESEKVASLRYEYIDKLAKECIGESQRVYGVSKVDKFILNRFLALPIFLCFLALAFYLTFFTFGKWLSYCFQCVLDVTCFNPLLKWIVNLFGENSWVVGLVENALIGGVGSIVSFLPQVALLFLFLSILEDSGYLSRVAFLFDDVLAKVGLSGKAVYTLLMGFGCSTSSVLTARNMEDKHSKIKTAILTPYMSCSAKFPIYSVLGGAFFGARNIWVILGLYLLGVVVAVFISFILEKTLLKSKAQSFILEFPPYRVMSAKRTFSLLWQNMKLFLTRVGSLILAMNVVVWVLSNFTIKLSYIGSGAGVSILETLGRLLSPIFMPLGFGNWALVAALIAGLVAKEVVVSSIAMFNGVDGSSGVIGSSVLSLSSVACFVNASSLLSYLVFCLLYVPCFATISVLSKEIGGKWTTISIIIELVVAYLISFIVYNIGSAIEIYGFATVLVLLSCLLLIICSAVFIGKKIKGRKVCPFGKKCEKNCKRK